MGMVILFFMNSHRIKILILMFGSKKEQGIPILMESVFKIYKE